MRGQADSWGTGTWPQGLAHRHRLTVETVITRWAAGLDYALDLGEEAQRLSEVLS